jgi:hypothetical protein
MKFTYRSDRDAIKQILRTEGIRGLYRAYGATVLSFGPFSGLYFMFYEKIKLWFTYWNTYQAIMKIGREKIENPDIQKMNGLGFFQSMVAGWTAGGLAATITNPLDLAKLRM